MSSVYIQYTSLFCQNKTAQKVKINSKIYRINTDTAAHFPSRSTIMATSHSDCFEMYNVEKSRFAQERLSMEKLLQEHKETISRLEDKLRDKEDELGEANRNFLGTKDELEKYTAIAKRLETTENACGRWTMAKVIPFISMSL